MLGTLAALTLTRYTRFRGRVLFSGMVFAPLVMPEVITGLSLLLLFVAIGLDRGFLTVTLAHITFTMCFVAVVVQSRLMTFDRSLEEAAMDLGAPPVKTFFQITLPVIAPAIVSGWMLAFTLSLDDLVIASFTSGPGATTLPMKIYSQVRLGVTPEINAACTLMIARRRRRRHRRLDRQQAPRGPAPARRAGRPAGVGFGPKGEAVFGQDPGRAVRYSALSPVVGVTTGALQGPLTRKSIVAAGSAAPAAACCGGSASPESASPPAPSETMPVSGIR